MFEQLQMLKKNVKDLTEKANESKLDLQSLIDEINYNDENTDYIKSLKKALTYNSEKINKLLELLTNGNNVADNLIKAEETEKQTKMEER